MAEKAETGRMTLLSLAVPILLEQILRTLMGTVNTFMLSRLSDDASAAVGVANQILNVVIIASTMLAAGTAIVLNQSLGAKREREAAEITMNSLTVSVLVGLALSAVAVAVPRQLVGLLGLEEKLIGDAAAYLRVVGASCVVQFASAMVAVHFRCRGKAQVPMLVIGVVNALNLLGSFLVVNGNLPLKSVGGIAWVRFISETLGLGFILLLFAQQKWGVRWGDLVRLRWEHVRKIVSLGFMSGAEGISYNLAQLVTTSFITMLPSAVLSAKVYVQTVNNYTYMAGLAVGQAAQILAGHMIGAGEEERAYRFVRRSWIYVLGLNLVFSVAFYLLSPRLIALFTSSVEIWDIARTLFFIDIFICLGRSLNHSYNYGLRSAGYVFWPMVVANCSIWAVSVGLGYGLTVAANMGIVGLWLSQMADEWLRGLCAAWLWLRRKWQKAPHLSGER